MSNCQDCNSSNISLQGTWFSTSPCTPTDCDGDSVNALCVIYNGPNLACSGVETLDSLEVALQKIDEQICAISGDYSTYNMNCLPTWWEAAITTEEEFVDAITAYACDIDSRLTVFINTTYQDDQLAMSDRVDALEVPGITCTSASVTGTDTLQQILTKYCSKFDDIDTALDISGVVWDNCLVVVGTPSTLADGFQLLADQICDVYTLIDGGGILPTFNNYASCIAGTSDDSLVTTIGLIKTRLCLTPTLDNDNLSSTCISIPADDTDLETLLQSMLDGLDITLQNVVTFDGADFVVVATDPFDACAGVTVSLATPINQDRFVASNASDTSPSTLVDKLTSSGSIAFDDSSNVTIDLDIADADYGDITVSGTGLVWTIDNDVVTFAKMQNVNTGILLGRSTAGSGNVEEISIGSGLTLAAGTLSVASATTRISALIAANNGNTIDNGNYAQEWQWNTLSGANGLKLSSSSTAGTSQYLLYVTLSGAYASASASGAAAYFDNTHTGTNNTNTGIIVGASGGTTNYGVVCWGAGGQWGTAAGASIYAQGRMRIDGQIDTYGSTSGIVTIKPAANAGTWTLTLPTTAGSSGQVLTTDGAGTTSWTSGVTEGTYTPTASNDTNIASSTTSVSNYIRIGDTVTVWGKISIDVTTAATLSILTIDLPISSAIGGSALLAGTGASDDGTPVKILADGSSDVVSFEFTPVTNTNNEYSFHFTYRIVAP